MIENNITIAIIVTGMIIVTIILCIYIIFAAKKKVYLEEKVIRENIGIMIFFGYFVVPGLGMIIQQIIDKAFYSEEILIGSACFVPEIVAVIVFLRNKLKFKKLKRIRNAENKIYYDRFKT